MRVSGWLFLMQQTGGSLVLLMMTCRMLHVRPPCMRLFAAALVCAAAALASCMTGSILSSVAAACCIFAAPRLCGVRLPGGSHLRALMLLLCLSCICSGLLRALSSLTPPLLLPLFSVLLFLIPALDRRLPPAGCATVCIAVAGRHIRLTALVDSGNLLRDPLTALPVIVCSRRALYPLDPAHRRLRLICVRTAAGSALMPVFRADTVRLLCSGKWQNVSALIGIAPESYDGFQALVPAVLAGTSASLPS